MSVCLCCVASHHFWVMYVLGKVCFLYEETRKAMVSVVDTKKPSLLLLLLRLLRTTSLPPPSPPSLPGEWAPVAHDIWPGATGWTSSVPLSSSAVTTCGIYGTMVGGFGVFGAGDHIEKTFTGLPPHTALRIRATFFKIDQCAATPRCVPPLRWCFCFAAV